jgi:hypothetical protein
MKWIAFFVIVACAAAIAGLPALAQGKDKLPPPPRPRILFMFAPDADNKQAVTEYEMLQKALDAFDNSDIHTIIVVANRPVKMPPDGHVEQAADLRKHYHIDADAFRLVLVGEDGWEKMRWTEPVDPHQVISHANEMPRPKESTTQ